MKKKRVMFLLLVMLLGFLAGCAQGAEKPEKIKDVEYTVQKEGELPEELLAKIKEKQKEPLRTPGEALAYCKTLFKPGQGEQFYSISLDKNKRVLHADLITRGTPTRTAVYPRLVVECALRHGACSVILAHNHPSGDARPSREDVDATLAVRNALSAIDINLFDHIVVAGETGYSFNLTGMIKTADGEANQE